MPYITGYTTELSESFHFWSGKVHVFLEEGCTKTVTFDLLNFIPVHTRASLLTCCTHDTDSPVLTEIKISHPTQIRSQVSLYLASRGNIRCSHISAGVIYAVGCQQDLRAAECQKIIVFNLWVQEHSNLHISVSPYLKFASDSKRLMVLLRLASVRMFAYLYWTWTQLLYPVSNQNDAWSVEIWELTTWLLCRPLWPTALHPSLEWIIKDISDDRTTLQAVSPHLMQVCWCCCHSMNTWFRQKN